MKIARRSGGAFAKPNHNRRLNSSVIRARKLIGVGFLFEKAESTCFNLIPTAEQAEFRALHH